MVIHRTAEPETWYDSERRRRASPSGERERRKVVIQIVVRRSVVQDIVEQTETRPADVVGLQCW